MASPSKRARTDEEEQSEVESVYDEGDEEDPLRMDDGRNWQAHLEIVRNTSIDDIKNADDVERLFPGHEESGIMYNDNRVHRFIKEVNEKLLQAWEKENTELISLLDSKRQEYLDKMLDGNFIRKTLDRSREVILLESKKLDPLSVRKEAKAKLLQYRRSLDFLEHMGRRDDPGNESLGERLKSEDPFIYYSRKGLSLDECKPLLQASSAKKRSVGDEIASEIEQCTRKAVKLCMQSELARRLFHPAGTKNDGSTTQHSSYDLDSESDEGEFVDRNRLRDRDTMYGIEVGKILDKAVEISRKKQSGGDSAASNIPPGASILARFCDDYSLEMPSEGSAAEEAGEDAFAHQIYKCHATTGQVDLYWEFDTTSHRSHLEWSGHGLTSFTHFGAGWKNRDFGGVLARWPTDPSQEIATKKLENEFFTRPWDIFCWDDMAWIAGDKRVKGFNSTIMDEERNSCEYVLDARETVRNCKILKLGNNICLLQNDVLKMWDLSSVPRHDGVDRMVNVDGAPEELIKCCNMHVDDSAEGSPGAPPASAAACSLRVPDHVGYLPGGRVLCFATGRGAEGPFRAELVDAETLRVTGELVGHVNQGLRVAPAPGWAALGGGSVLVTSDNECAKLWDVRAPGGRAGRAQLTFAGPCDGAVPMTGAGGGAAEHLCLSSAFKEGAKVVDLRMEKPLYALPGRGPACWMAPAKGLFFGEGNFYAMYGGDPLRHSGEGYPDGRADKYFAHLEEQTWGKLKNEGFEIESRQGCSIA